MQACVSRDGPALLECVLATGLDRSPASLPLCPPHRVASAHLGTWSQGSTVTCQVLSGVPGAQHPSAALASSSIRRETSTHAVEERSSPKSSSGTFHPKGQAFSTQGVSLPSPSSPEHHHMGFLDLSASPGLPGGWPPPLQGPGDPQMNSGASRSLWFRPTLGMNPA